jgi:hypothetical protein
MSTQRELWGWTGQRYPNTPEGRAKAREHIRRIVIARAEIEAGKQERSLRCQQGDHRVTDPDGRYHHGCANSGAECLCQCHDAQTEAQP